MLGFGALDSEPEKIVKRMSRRDGFDGDFVEINIDSYHDKRTAFSFTASVSGVKGDEYVTNNGDSWDGTWDPIWYLKTSVDDQGWIAEFKIPLSQLRFANKENHTWGIQFTRRFFRKEERSVWQPINPTDPGWVHLFGEMNGIKGIKPQKQLEIQPYIVATNEKYEKEEGNPFRESGNESSVDVGLDAKIGLTSDITLDLTVNPDFGQVEADPSQVNLTAFEQFFSERRPFFLEGNNLFNYYLPGNPSRHNLFYSRRIGAPAHGELGDDIEYSDTTPKTRILSAAKITGKNKNGFSWGVLEAITGKLNVDVIDTLGVRRSEKIEPFTNYFSTRFQQDINEGNTIVGAMYNHMNRIDNEGNELEYLHSNAQSVGIDVVHNINDRKYQIDFGISASRVEGKEESITSTQESFRRTFQRPNNDYREVDTTLTKLTGSAARLAFGKNSGNWRWRLGANYRSPGFEVNDMGFLPQVDDINLWSWSQYRVTKPKGYLRWQRYNINIEQNYDFGYTNTNTSMSFEANLGFNKGFINYWELGNGVWIQGTNVSNADLRGGPSITMPGGINYWYWIGTNPQKKIRLSFNNWFYWGNQDVAKNSGISMNLTVRPSDALRVTLSPNISWRRSDLQYVTQEYDSASMGTRYILGTIEQKTISFSIRANYNITPNLTLEFWGQPFVAKGVYNEFKRIHNSNSENYQERFRLFEENEISFDSDKEVYQIFESNGANPDYQFDSPDFKSVEFRSNFVVRWEYVPGSTLFLVWANNGSDDVDFDVNNFNSIKESVFNLKGTNTFLIKYTYRFIL